MTLSEQAELVTTLSLKDNMSAGIKKVQGTMGRLNLQTKQLQQGLGKIGQGIKTGFKRSLAIGAIGIGLLTAGVKAGISSLAELEDLQRATQQTLKTTGRVSGQTGKSIRNLASELEDLTTVDDKVIQGGENLLLTFTNVRRRAFEPAVRAALDMSVALGQDFDTAIRTVGRSLNDPIKGLSRLTRVGVQFTDAEVRKITQLQKSGKLFEAQQIILGKLNRLYGGRAKTAAQGYRGQVNRMNDAVEDLTMSLAKPLLRPLTRLTTQLAKFAKSDDVQQGLRNIGQTVADFFTDENIANGITAVKNAFVTLRDDIPWDVIRQQAAFAAGVARQALDIFNSLPPEVKGALITMLAANKLTGGLVASGLRDIATFTLRSLTTINAAHVTVTGPVSGTPGTPGPGGTGGGGGNGGGGVIIPGIGAVGVIDGGYIREKLDSVQELMGRSVEYADQDVRENRTLTARGNEIAAANKGASDKIAAQAIHYALYQKQMDQKQLEQDRAALQRQVNAVQTQGTSTREQMMRDAARVAGAIRAKDLSVTVNTSVSLREVADGVTKVASRNRVVTD